MIKADLQPGRPVVYQTHLQDQFTWVSGTFEGFMVPTRTRLGDNVIVTPSDKRALEEQHRRGAVPACDVYAVPSDLCWGDLSRTGALMALGKSPAHPLREQHISQILDCLDSIAENYLAVR